jgi:hypothetical protein
VSGNYLFNGQTELPGLKNLRRWHRMMNQSNYTPIVGRGDSARHLRGERGNGVHLNVFLSADFVILAYAMPSDTPAQSSGRDRREYYRITVTLPTRIQAETDNREGECTKKSVNISGGGIGVTVTGLYKTGEVLSLTLLLPDEHVFTTSIEVVRIDPVPDSSDTYRIHARFLRMTTQTRELLIRYIVRFQRDHLQEHYSV